MATTSEIQVTEAYIGLLGRAPDPAGLAYWTNQLDKAVAAGQDATFALKKLTNDIALSPEYSTGIGANVPSEGNPSQTQADAIVTALYQNLFERAPTQADLDYWTPQLTGGSTTAPEMTLNLITAAKSNTAKPADGQILGFKQEAATYYVETVPQDKFSKDSATQAVADVDGPATLAASKTATDYVASGTGITTDLATIGAGNDVPMTGGDDVVTGTVGAGATYTTQNVKDSYTSDNDTLTLTGDNGFTFDDVTNVENVNVNLSDSLGAGFAIDATKVLGSTINIDVADKVTIAGVQLDGETVVSVDNLSTSSVTTTDVTSLTLTDVGNGATTVTTDSDAATIVMNEIDANDTTLVASATTLSLDLDGSALTTDKAAISAAGKVTLDVSAADLVENLTLSGNGAAVTYTISGNTPANSSITVSGDQDVTLAGAGTEFTGIKSFTDSSTAGSTTLALSSSGGGAVVASGFGLLSGGVELTGSFGAQTLTVATGNTIKVSADQAAAITIATNDDGSTGTITLDVDNDTKGITTTDVDKITIDTGSRATKIDGVLNVGDNEGEIVIVGTNDVTVTGTTTGGDVTVNANDANFAALTANGELKVTAEEDFIATGNVVADNDATVTANDITLGGQLSTADSGAADGSVKLTATGEDVDITGAVNIDGSLTVAAEAGKFTSAAAVDAENDITITAVAVKVDSTLGTSVAGDLVITATNDVDINGAVTVTKGDATIKQTSAASATGIAFQANAIAADNDITITGATDVQTAVVTSNKGSVVITAQNDVDLDANVTAAVNLTVESKAGAGKNVDFDGFTLKADNDITVTSADAITGDQLVTVDGNVKLTAANEITLKNAVGDSDIDGTFVAESTGGTNDATIRIQDNIDVENDITLTAVTVSIEETVKVEDGGAITVTATNDVELGLAGTGVLENANGSVTVKVTGTGDGYDVLTNAAGDAILATNDVTVTADDIKLGNVTSSKAGHIVITAANDADLDGAILNQTSGNITITAGEVVAGAGDALNIAGAVTGENDITITASAGGELAIADDVTSNTAGDITITGGKITANAGGKAITATKGDIIVNATNDTEVSAITKLTADAGSITILSGNFNAITDTDASAGGVTIAGDAQGTFTNIDAENSEVRITTTNDVSITTIDTSVVVATGGGDYALGTVTSSTEETVQITTGAGNDSMTLNADERYTVVTGDGIDTVTGTDSKATSVVNTGGGDDVFDITSGNFQGTVDMGAGTGDKVVLTGGGAGGDLSAGAVWQNIEILQLKGNTILSYAQLANDTSFEIQGTNSKITVASVTSIDLSNVGFQAGNTSTFDLTGTANADTITGSDGVDTITGGGGADTLVGGLGADDFVYSDDAGIGTAGTLAAAQGDAVTFVAADDAISLIGDFATANLTSTNADAVNAIVYNAGVDFNGGGTGDDSVQLVGAGLATATVADALTLADLNTALGAIANEAVGDERILAFVTGDGNTVMYKYTGVTANGTLEANELQLIAIFTDTMTAGDFTFT